MNGRVVDRWPRRDARQLLKLLALQPGHRLSRERVIQALWPVSETADVDHRLNNAIYALRNALEPGRPARAEARFVGSGSDWVGLKSEAGVVVDAECFERWVQAAPDAAGEPESLWHALEAYAGALLPDDEAEHWTTAPREHLAALYALTVRRIADHRIARGEYASTITLLKRWVELMPAEEEAHRRLIEALVAAGRPRDAQRQLEDCCVQLRAELGVEPSPATLAALAAARPLAPEPAATQGDEAWWDVPAPHGELLDRSCDLARTLDRFTRGTSRIVTLTGPGGVGKTQLALHAARQARALRRHGVVFVSLDDVLLGPAVTCAVGGAISRAGARPAVTLAEIAAAIGSRELLLVLDNLEHVLDEAAEIVSRLTAACPALWLLCTSRTQMNLIGEHVLRLAPLAFPPEDAVDWRMLVASPAVQLFGQRAAQGDTGFVLNEGNAVRVAAVCRRLDGLPLALELAAARVRFFGLDELGRRIEQSIDDLRHPRRGAPQRHSSLHEVLDWSYRLLPSAARQLLGALSLFAEGFTLEAAMAVDDQGSEATLAQLDLLLQHHFVQPDADGEHQPRRYRLLRTVRLFAQERLAERDDVAAVRCRFALQWAIRAQTLARLHDEGRTAEAISGFERDRSDFDAAMACAAQADLGIAHQLIGMLATFWCHCGHAAIGVHWVHRVLDPAQAPVSTWQVQAHLGAAALLSCLSMPADAIRHGERALDGLDSWPELEPLRASVLRRLAGLHIRRGAPELARRLCEQALVAAERQQHQASIGSCHVDLVYMARHVGDYDAAARHSEMALALSDLMPKTSATPLFFNLALLARLRGDWEAAWRMMDRAVLAATECGEGARLCCILIDRGELLSLTERTTEARVHLARARELNDAAQYPYVEAFALQQSAIADVVDGAWAMARAGFQRSVALHREAGWDEQTDITHLWWARACRHAGDIGEAALHLRRVLTRPKSIRHYLLPSILEEAAVLLHGLGRGSEVATLWAQAAHLRRLSGLRRAPAEQRLLGDVLAWTQDAAPGGDTARPADPRTGLARLYDQLGIGVFAAV